MNSFIHLTKRNCLVYIRDKGTIFFSLLSMLIVLMLMVVFLGNMNVEMITDLFAEYGGERDIVKDRENATHLIEYWTLAGILATNAVTVTMAVMTTMVDDALDKKRDSFFCTPVSKFTVAVSYIVSAIIIGMFLCIVPFIIFLIYIVISGGALLSIKNIIAILGCMLLNVFIFSIIMYLAALFVKSVGAWSGLGTIIGTLVGFVGGIYLPIGQLPEKVAEVLKYIPVLHGTSLIRKLCCEDIIAKTFDQMPIELIDGYKEAMGITVVMGDKVVSSGFQVGFLLICGMIALGMILVFSKHKG